jgi:hypothetical protein
MENPTKWRYCSLGSFPLERTDLMMGKFAHRLRAVPFHSIRSSGTRRLSPSGRLTK